MGTVWVNGPPLGPDSVYFSWVQEIHFLIFIDDISLLSSLVWPTWMICWPQARPSWTTQESTLVLESLTLFPFSLCSPHWSQVGPTLPQAWTSYLCPPLYSPHWHISQRLGLWTHATKLANPVLSKVVINSLILFQGRQIQCKNV